MEADMRAAVEVLARFRVGDPFDQGELPDIMWCSHEKDDRRKTIPHLLKANGYLTVSQEMRAVLEQFDLGDFTFSPVTLLHMDRKTPYPGQYAFLHIPHRKLGFAPKHSCNYEPRLFEEQEHLGTVPWDIKDNDISVAPLALDGPDIWHDLSLVFSLFFSDRAYQALKTAGLSDDLMAVRCPVVGVH